MFDAEQIERRDKVRPRDLGDIERCMLQENAQHVMTTTSDKNMATMKRKQLANSIKAHSQEYVQCSNTIERKLPLTGEKN